MTRDELLERLGITTEAAAWPIDAYVAAERERLAGRIDDEWHEVHQPKIDRDRYDDGYLDGLERAEELVRESRGES